MYKAIFICLSLCFTSIVSAQQDAQFTQFMFNKIVYNPGYAGSAEVPSLTAIHRSQWTGLEGAPTSQAFTFHTPFRQKRVGAGISINHDEIGPTNSIFIALSYAYRIPLKKGTLGIGLQGAIRHYRVNWDQIKATHEGDALITDTENSKLLPNAGVGIYYESPLFYIGVSSPHLLRGDISLLNNVQATTDIQAVEDVHSYLMAGFIVPLSKSVKFKPAVLVKYVERAPFDMDINGSFVFADKLWLGATYRLGGSTVVGNGESIDLVAQYQVGNAFRIGMAYDITLSEVKDYNNGTYELMLQYYIQKDRTRFTNPRFF